MTENIGSDSVAWQKVVKKCRNNPLLMRELMLLVQKQKKEQLQERHREHAPELLCNEHPIQTPDLLPKMK